MNIVFYIVIFLIGVIIGEFWNEQVTELPQKLDLKKTHYSNKKNEKIITNITYAVIGGIISLILAFTLKITPQKFDIVNLIIYIFTMLYMSTLVIIAGIDKNYSKIDKKMLAYGVVTSMLYMIYISIIAPESIYLNLGYLLIYTILLLIDAFLLRKFAKDSYIINLLILIAITLVYSNFIIVAYTLVMTLIGILVYIFILNIQKKKNGNKKIKINEIPFGYFISASNIIILFMVRILESYFV